MNGKQGFSTISSTLLVANFMFSFLRQVWNATKWNDELTLRPNYELDTLVGHEHDVNYVQFSGCAAPTRPLLADSAKEDSQTKFKNTWCVSNQ